MIFLLQKTLVYAVPLLIVALAGVFAERSGIINIALDGMMIFGSFCGAVFVYFCQSAGAFRGMPQILFLLALLVSGAAGALFSWLLSFASVKLKADQTIGGTALNLLAPAISLLLVKVFLQQDKLVMPKDLDYVIMSDNLPGFLQIFFDKAYLSTYLIIILFAILSIFLYKTKTGLRLRACGEHPQAADSVGINVYKMRYLGSARRDRRLRLHRHDGGRHGAGYRRGHGLPRPCDHDLRQLETDRNCARFPALRISQMYRPDLRDS